MEAGIRVVLSLYSREEFDEHGLGDVVTLMCRDVCVDGFGLENVADAGSDTSSVCVCVCVCLCVL